MTTLKLIAIAAELIKEGKTDAEIERALYNTKGSRCSQIDKVMNLIRG